MEIPIHKIAELPREEVIAMLLNFPGTFKFDFTPEYLQGLETDQLRHMLLAAIMHASRDRKPSCDPQPSNKQNKFAS
jgi:hypothetical protein